MSSPPLYEAALARGSIEPERPVNWTGPSEHAMTATRGMVTLLLPLASMFILLLTAYAFRRLYADWQPVSLPWQLWLSTAILLASSAGMEYARRGAAAVNADQVRGGLLIASVTALLFLGSQYWAWQALQSAGYTVAANPANSFIYLLTALHGAHLIGGLLAWLKTRSALASGAGPEVVALYVKLLTIYWHFLLAIWIMVFAMFLLRG